MTEYTADDRDDVEPEGWRDIGSAPKDGSNIIGTDGITSFIMWWLAGVLKNEKGDWRLREDEKTKWRDFRKMTVHPTHWMPLPEPPK